MKRKILFSLLSSVLLSACGESPRNLLDQVVKEKSFIPFQLPMPSTRVGTMLNGNDREMYLIARPERCFPDLAGPSSLRWVQPTDLPSQYRKVEFGFHTDVNPIIESGNLLVTFKATAKYVKTVQIELKDASVEFLDEASFRNFYVTGMSEECKGLLAQYPFIVQGLRIEAMNFVFKEESGVVIDLTARIEEIVDIAAGVNWRIENNYTLNISTPKYIGYRMGKLGNSTSKLGLMYASTTDENGNWVFKDLNDPGNGNRPLEVTPMFPAELLSP